MIHASTEDVKVDEYTARLKTEKHGFLVCSDLTNITSSSSRVTKTTLHAWWSLLSLDQKNSFLSVSVLRVRSSAAPRDRWLSSDSS